MLARTTGIKSLAHTFNSVSNNHHGNDFSNRKYSFCSNQKSLKEQLNSKISDVILENVAKHFPKLNKNSHLSDANTLYKEAVRSFANEKYPKEVGLGYLKSALQAGSRDALTNIGIILTDKDAKAKYGLKPNPPLGFESLEESGRCGDGNAYMYLGFCSLKGQGTEQNIDNSIQYFKKADALGIQKAAKIIDFIKADILSTPKIEEMNAFIPDEEAINKEIAELSPEEGAGLLATQKELHEAIEKVPEDFSEETASLKKIAKLTPEQRATEFLNSEGGIVPFVDYTRE